MAFNGTHPVRSFNCTHCGIDFLSKFTGSSKATSVFCSSACKTNHRLESRKTDYKKKIYELYNGAKTRAKRDGRDFDLTLGFIEKLWDDQKGQCLLSGRAFEWGSGPHRNHRDAPTLDRIDSERGYTQDNVRLITYHLNIAINKYGLEAFKELAQEVCYRG